MSFIYEKPLQPALPTFGGGQATFAEVWSASRDLAIYADNFNAEESAIEEAYDRRIDAIMTATGVAVKNPMREPTGRAAAALGRPQRAQNIEAFNRHLVTLQERFPDHARAIRASVPIEDDAKTIARQAEARFGRDIGSRQDFSGKWTAAIGGGFAGSLRDPVQVATLVAGGGPGAARTIAGRILTVAVKEMVINGAVEAAMQPKVQAWREKAGLPAGLAEAARNTVFAAAAGGFFGLGGQMVAEAGRAIFKGRLLDSAAALAGDGLDPASSLAQTLRGAPTESLIDLKPIRDALPPEARGAIDAQDVVMPGDEARHANALRFAEEPEEGRLGDLRRELMGETGARPTGRQPVSLLTFLAREGGLAEHGDLAAIDAGRWFGPGGRLVRKEGGLTLDEARRRAVEAGYLADTGYEGGVSVSTIDDLTDAIGAELEGRKVYSRFDGDAEELSQRQRQHDDTVALIDEVIGKLEGVMSDDLPPGIRRRAADIMLGDESADPDIALERAIMEDYYSGEPERALTYDDGSEIPFETDDGAGSAGQRGDAARARQGASGREEGGLAEDGETSGRAGEAEGVAGQRALGIPENIGRPISSHGNATKVREHPDFRAAKAGDIEAAARLVDDMASAASLAEARQRIKPGAIFIYPNAIEASGQNKIPAALADLYADATGGRASAQIVQANRVFHTDAGATERMIARPVFDGPVEKGARYVLVDDVSTLGGTLAELADFIRRGGAEVEGVVLLVNASRSDILRASPEVVRTLKEKFGDVIRQELGIAPEALTAAEARHVARFRDADSLRNSIAEARGRGRSGISAQASRAEGEDPGGLSEFGQDFGRPAEPAGGVDDPLSPEEVKLTDDMLKELDPDGALADTFPEAKALKDEAEELGDLATFITHCKAGP